MANTEYNLTEDGITKLQQLKGKTKSEYSTNISNFYINMNIRMVEDTFSKNAQGIGKIYHEKILLMKFSQTKSHVKNMNIKYYDLYYTVKKR